LIIKKKSRDFLYLNYEKTKAFLLNGRL